MDVFLPNPDIDHDNTSEDQPKLEIIITPKQLNYTDNNKYTPAAGDTGSQSARHKVKCGVRKKSTRPRTAKW